jgi:hypothetical protein
MEDMEMDYKKMDREEILKYAAEQDGPDEREEQVDVSSGDDAYFVGLIVCGFLAIIKTLVFRKRPYDIFAVEFASETAYMYKKWKRMRQDKYLLGMAVNAVLFMISLGCFFQYEMDDAVKKNNA